MSSPLLFIYPLQANIYGRSSCLITVLNYKLTTGDTCALIAIFTVMSDCDANDNFNKSFKTTFYIIGFKLTINMSYIWETFCVYFTITK